MPTAAHPFTQFQPATALYHPDNAVALARAARLAYNAAEGIPKVAASWGFPRCRFIARRETQAVVMGNKSTIVVAFRGTANLQNWLTNIKVSMRAQAGVRVHEGFALAVDSVWDEFRPLIKENGGPEKAIWITGHSLGGALANWTRGSTVNLILKPFMQFL